MPSCFTYSFFSFLPSLPLSFLLLCSYFSFWLKYLNQIHDHSNLPQYTLVWMSKTKKAIFKQNHAIIITFHKINNNFLLSSNTLIVLKNGFLQLVCKIGNQIKSTCGIWFLFSFSFFNLKQALLPHSSFLSH